MISLKYICATFGMLALSACAMSTSVMDAGNGTYMISAQAAPIRGGAAGARSVAYADAQEFCAQKGAGVHAIIIDAKDRDIYQGSVGGSPGNFGGGIFAAGNANIHFRCGT